MSGSRHKRLTRIVSGALRDAITQHGPIDGDRINSATKRIVGQLMSEGHAESSEAERVEWWRGRYEKLRYGHDRVVAQRDALAARLAEQELGDTASPAHT